MEGLLGEYVQFLWGLLVGMVLCFVLILILQTGTVVMEYGDRNCLVERLNYKIVGCFNPNDDRYMEK